MKRFINYFFCFFSVVCNAQEYEPYLFPIQPGKKASLAGNLGELRSFHFHSGIDIRTNNQINYPVFATQKGFVSRVSISPSGYGNVLYVTHPDGNTSVYAHLESFMPSVAKLVIDEQYKRKTFDIDLLFETNQVMVSRGDTIAFSGNTGSSSGPHLHFDIRDKNNAALDPLAFKFPEVVDQSSPYTEKLALVTLDNDSRVNNRFGRTEYYVQKNGNNFSLPVPILALGKIGLEVIAKDKLAIGSSYFGGVNFIEVYANDDLIFKQTIEKLDLSEGRTINTLLNFRSLKSANQRFYKLYKDDGNTLDFYSQSPSNGILHILADQKTIIKIIYKDVFNNQSSLSFTLVGEKKTQKLPLDFSQKKPLKAEIVNNTLAIQVAQPFDSVGKAWCFSKESSQELTATYGGNYSSTFLIDLRKTLIDSVKIANLTYKSHLKTRVPAGTDYTFYDDNLEIAFPKGALYDTLYLALEKALSPDSTELLTLGDPMIPLHKPISISWKPAAIPSWDKTWAVYRKSGKSHTFLGGSIVNDRIHFSTRDFGTFTLLQDLVPPSIKPIVVNSSYAVFKINDALAGIEKYEATINGLWLLMELDGKSGTLKSKRLPSMNFLKGELILTVTDRAGNTQIFKKQI